MKVVARDRQRVSLKTETPRNWKEQSMKATKGIDAPKKDGDAGYDLRSDHVERIHAGSVAVFECAAVEIPEGYCGLVIGRSSLNGIGILTVFGLIDSGFRGNIRVMLFNISGQSYPVDIDQRIAQLVLVPFGSFPLEYVDELTPSERGDSGFGSTGKS